jgi:hypothetical protein
MITNEVIEAIVLQATASFSAIFDFMFEPSVLMVWGPPFVLLLSANLMRVALGKRYAPGPDQLETFGERLLRDEMRRGRE